MSIRCLISSKVSAKGFEIPRKFYHVSAITSIALTLLLPMSVFADTGAMTSEEFHSSRQFADTSFGRIAYVERGSGPVALFVHGALLNGYQWRHQLTALSDMRHCIALDTMGMGYTEVAPGQPISMKDQAAMIAAFLDTLDVDTIDIIGNNSGGGIVQLFAATHPGRIRSMTLTNCEVRDYDKNNPVSEQLRQTITSGFLAGALRAAVRNPEKASVSLNTVYQYPDQVTADTIHTYFDPIVSSLGRVKGMETYFLSMFSTTGLLEVEEQLLALEAPKLIIWGMADTFFEKKWAYWLKDNLKNVREIVEVKDGLLFFPEEYPAVMNENLRSFWNSLEK